MNINSIETIETENFVTSIEYDECSESPREWCNLSTMICFHNRYNLGDKHNFDKNDYDSWDELEKAILKEYGRDAIIQPVYMLDHSGVALNTTGFGCPWDSGQVGFIVVSRADVRENWNVKRVTKEILLKVEYSQKCEVETYSQYLNGEVYCYTVENKETEEIMDSCGGYFGIEDVTKEAQESMNFHQEQYNIKHGVQMELEIA